jgi:hypothetical protein
MGKNTLGPTLMIVLAYFQAGITVIQVCAIQHLNSQESLTQQYVESLK